MSDSDFKDFNKHDDMEVISKTAIKNEMLALQKLGDEVAALSSSELKQIPLEERLLDAIMLARKLPQREGRRRQMQYVGKLMRDTDHEAIIEALDKLRNNSRAHTKLLHDCETWRDRMIAEGDSVSNEFCDIYYEADRQYIRQIIRAAQKDISHKKPPANARKLYSYIKEQLTAADNDSYDEPEDYDDSEGFEDSDR